MGGVWTRERERAREEEERRERTLVRVLFAGLVAALEPLASGSQPGVRPRNSVMIKTCLLFR